MNRYSSSTLKIFNRNCPAALGFYEDNTPYDRELFQQGVAAHAVLQVIGEKRVPIRDDYLDKCEAIADNVVAELSVKGRSYKGKHEPPMSPEDAQMGREIALEYLDVSPLVLPENAMFEVLRGMDSLGNVTFDEDAIRYDAIFDVIYMDTVGDEDYSATVAVVDDYKSAWPTGESELETMQMRGHAVLAWLHLGDRVQGVKSRAINLRTKQVFERTVYFDDEGIMLLKRWREDILQACLAADNTREARPGAGCIDCKYVLTCEDCIDAFRAIDEAPVTFATAKALVTELGKQVRSQAKVAGIPVPGGVIEYRPTQEKIPTDDAINKLIERWWLDDPDPQQVSIGEVRGLLMALDLKATSFEKVAKVLYPEKGNASIVEMIEECVTTKAKSRFDVYKV